MCLQISAVLSFVEIERLFVVIRREDLMTCLQERVTYVANRIFALYTFKVCVVNAGGDAF